jgi:23S rRNA (uracil1939-C5)-methyltransferase
MTNIQANNTNKIQAIYRIKEHTGTFKFAVIRATNLSSSVTFILNREAQDLKAGIKLIKDVQGNIGAENIIIGYSTKEGATSISDDIEVIKGSKYLKERIGDKVFSFHSQGFFQVNEEIASIMVGYVREILSEKGNNVLADLYGGVGLLGVSCADLFNEVFIVEAYEDSILLAEKNALFNGVRNIRTFNLDAKRMDLVKIDASKDFKVILDPPRSGMTAKAIKKILKMRASKIIYVSCNPKKFSQEIEKFTNRGYDIKSCAIFDMFPGTKHIEIVAEFERDESEF